MYRQTITSLVLVFGFVCGAASNAAAQAGQAWTERGYFNINAGFENTTGEITDAVNFTIYNEPGSLQTTQAVDSGALFDISGGARVWRNVSVGIAYHTESTTGEGSATASVPNPVFFNQNRSVALALSDLNRSESAVHLQFGYMVPVSDVLDVHVTLGPSFFSLKQDVLSSVTYTETGFPFTTVNATPNFTERSDDAVGFNIGVDVSYKFLTTGPVKLGAGMFLRYAGATVDVTVLDGSGAVVGSDVGGLQIGFGGRVRF